MSKTLLTDTTSQHTQPFHVYSQRWLMLAVLLLATFMGTLDTFIVNVAVPSMETNLHASFAEIQLVVAGYTLAFAVILTTGGRLGDFYGRKRIFLLGVTGFTLFSLSCGLASTVTWLIIFRMFQGGMAALMLPQVMALLNVSFLPQERGRAFSCYIATIGLAAIAGQVIGGFLLAVNVLDLGWRSIFLINLPVGLATVGAAWLLVRESRPVAIPRLDLGGVVLLSAALVLLIYPLTEGSSAGWSFWSLLSLLVALFLFGVFRSYEQRLARLGGAPLVPFTLFRSRAFVAGVFSTFLVQFLFAALLLTLAFYLQDGLHYLPWQSGLIMTVMGLAVILASSVSAHVVRKLKIRALHLGAALVTLGYLCTLLAVQFAVPHYGLAPLLPGLFLIASGNGTVSPLVMNKALREIDSSMAGAASGVYSSIQQVANALGVALIGTLFAVFLVHRANEVQSFTVSLLAMALVSLLLSLAIFLFPRSEETSDLPGKAI